MNLSLKKIFICAAICVAFPSLAQRQLNYTDFGFAVGGMIHTGEVSNGGVGAYISDARPQAKLNLKRTLASWFTVGIEAGYGYLSANDEDHLRTDRNYSVSTHLIQVNPFIELNFMKFGKYRREQTWTPYLKLGGGIVFYNPELNEDAVYTSLIELRPNAYSGLNFLIAFGAKIRTSYNSYLTLEPIIHFTNFDDIEGWRYSRNLTDNDVYGGFTVGYNYMIF
jgi:hypothetical protein